MAHKRMVYKRISYRNKKKKKEVDIKNLIQLITCLVNLIIAVINLILILK